MAAEPTPLVPPSDGQTSIAADPLGWFEPHRAELAGYCYRMLGSGFEAEDAVQETLTRAWRNADRLRQDRPSVRSWLYKVATNVCIDMLRSAQRRARAMDLTPATQGPPDFGAVLPDSRWIWPAADQHVLPDSADPAELAVQRDTIRLAFVAALQHLPPRQRAVLILREVLRWRADEVAELLDTTVASVNSLLQRARTGLADRDPAPTDPYDPLDPAQTRLLADYVDAFERHDIDRLVSLLHEEATTSMPPFLWWLRGRDMIGQLMRAGDGCRDDRLIPVAANGSPALGQYRLGHHGNYQPFALVVLGVSGGHVIETTTYLDATRLFPMFDLPLHGLPDGHNH